MDNKAEGIVSLHASLSNVTTRSSSGGKLQTAESKETRSRPSARPSRSAVEEKAAISTEGQPEDGETEELKPFQEGLIIDEGRIVAEKEVEPVEEKEPEKPYEPPPFNFIKVEFGDSAPIVMNPRCKKKILVDYINSKLAKAVNISAFDLCNTEGQLVGLRELSSYDNVCFLFVKPHVYIPCEVIVDEMTEQIIGIEPCLNDWRTKYPLLEEKLQILITERHSPSSMRDATPAATERTSGTSLFSSSVRASVKKKGKK